MVLMGREPASGPLAASSQKGLGQQQKEEAEPHSLGSNTIPTIEAASGVSADLGTAKQAVISFDEAPVSRDPTQIGRYVALRRIGEGGMGVVYSAYDPDLDRKVAIKVFRQGRERGTTGRARIMQEAQAMARVSHPNVVHVYEIGEDLDSPEQRVYIVMELVIGVSMIRWQQEHPLRNRAMLDRCLRLYLQAAAGLQAAHASALIHRDFKPDNVLVGEDGRVRVVDFGVARAIGGPTLLRASTSPNRTDSPGGSRLTQVGAIMGTPGYMAPEQVCGEEADARSDQFSFCAALYEALYGRPPFDGNTLEEYSNNVLYAELRQPLRSAGGAEVPLDLKQALMRGLSRNPAARFQSMQQLVAELTKGLLPDADSESIRQSKRRFLSFLLSCFLLTIVPVSVSLRESTDNGMRRLLFIAGLIFLATASTIFRLREKISLQPGYRRLSYFLLIATAYLIIGRSLGLYMGAQPARFLVHETTGLAALFACEVPHAGWRYLWLVLLCAVSIALQLVWPAARIVHLNVVYAFIIFFAIYFRFKKLPEDEL